LTGAKVPGARPPPPPLAPPAAGGAGVADFLAVGDQPEGEHLRHVGGDARGDLALVGGEALQCERGTAGGGGHARSVVVREKGRRGSLLTRGAQLRAGGRRRD
jgi:hypothetical protein